MVDVEYDVTVVGGVIQDLIRMPAVGETLVGDRFMLDFGGKGANQAVMTAKLGAKTAMVAMVGSDSFGASAIENLRKNNINCDHCTTDEYNATGTSSITVTNSGQNCIVCVLGANLSLSADNIHKAERTIRNSKVLLCQLENRIEVIEEALKVAKKHGVTTILNPAPVLHTPTKDLFKYTDIICPNETEAEKITGIAVDKAEGAERAAFKLLDLGAQSVVITLGEHGCMYVSKGDDKVKHIAATKVTAVDTTVVGAGDAFLGSLAYYTAKYGHLTFKERLERSCKIASTSVQRYGTQRSYLRRQELSDDLFA